MSVCAQERGLRHSLLPLASGHTVSTWPQPAGTRATYPCQHPKPCAGRQLSTPCRGEVKPKHPAGHSGALWTRESGQHGRSLPRKRSRVPTGLTRTHPPGSPASASHASSSSSLSSQHQMRTRPSLGRPSSAASTCRRRRAGQSGAGTATVAPASWPLHPPCSRGRPSSPRTTVLTPSTCTRVRHAPHTRRPHTPSHTGSHAPAQTTAGPCHPPGSLRTGAIAEILRTPFASRPPAVTRPSPVSGSRPHTCVLHRPGGPRPSPLPRGAPGT